MSSGRNALWRDAVDKGGAPVQETAILPEAPTPGSRIGTH
jgi:hypothetical protein